MNWNDSSPLTATRLLNHRSVFYILIAGLGITSFLALKLAWVSADAPYYLTLARHVSNGDSLYKDVINDYTPMVVYFFSIFYRSMGDPDYVVFLSGQLVVILLSGILVYLNLRLYKVDSWCSGIVSTAFCLAVMSSDGNYINLESFSVFFVLLAIYAVNRWQMYVVAGILLGFSFLCKQYGVLNYFPFAILILSAPVSPSLKFRRIVALGAGGLLVFLLFLAYYQYIERVDIAALLSQISGSSYSKYSFERQRTLISVLVGAKIFLLFGSYLIYVLVVTRRPNASDWFFIAGIVFCLVPVALQGFQHYFINTFPYIFLWIGLLVNRLEDRFVRISNAILLVVVCISSTLLIKRLFHYAPQQETQKLTSSKLLTVLPAGSGVFIDGNLRYLYVLNNYDNPLKGTIGFDYTYPATVPLADSKFDYIIMSSRKYTGMDTSIKTNQIDTESGMIYLYSR